MIQKFLPFTLLKVALELSERSLAHATGLSRGTIRQLQVDENRSVSLSTIEQLASFFKRDIEILATPESVFSEFSTIAVAMKVEQDGFDSWKYHFFDFVDEFRRTLDARLMILPPHERLAPELSALLASIVRDLSIQVGTATPTWAAKRNFLPKPWFVSGIQSLKANALLESPIFYRNNNIFVQENFLVRA